MEKRYEVIESKRWESKDGRTASLYGAVPWTSDADKANWTLVSKGHTIRDNQEGTVGLGRAPMPREEADALASRLNTRKV